MNISELKNIIPLLKDAEDKIIDAWLAEDDLKDILSEHTAPEYFEDNFAHSIFEYFINVVDGKSKIGYCPSMRRFLEYCSLEDFKVDEVYIICANFRHSVSFFLIENSLMNKEIYKHLNHILDKNLGGVLALYNDIVESKNRTISTHEHWISQYQKVIDKILIVSKADMHGNIIYANDKFVEISGFSKSELMGKPHNLVRNDDMPKAVFKNMWKTIKDKKPWSGVVKNRKKDGSSYYVSTIILPILDDEGNIIEFFSSRIDITELITLQEEKEKREKLFIKQSALAEMGHMIRLIAHQWKQPIASIGSITNNIIIETELETGSRDASIEQLEQINQIVQHLSNTLGDFQSFFKPSKIKVNIETSKIVENIFPLISARLNDLNIDFAVANDGSFNINLFANELKQVLLNIFNNAADIIEEKGITNGKLNISFEHDKKVGKIIISDNGGGIDASLLPDKLFEIYETTKGEKGTGIGLNLCMVIVEEKFNGKIYAHNKNDGATFIIELPLT